MSLPEGGVCRGGDGGGYDGKSDTGFAPGEKLLARYEGAEVTADKPSIRLKIAYERAFPVEFMPARSDSSTPFALKFIPLVICQPSSRRETRRDGIDVYVSSFARRRYRRLYPTIMVLRARE